MADRKAFFVTGEDFEIGPFRSKEAAVTEARALRDEEGLTGLRVRTERVSSDGGSDDPKSKTKTGSGSKSKTKVEDDDFDLDALFDDDDDEEDDDIEVDDDDDEEDDDIEVDDDDDEEDDDDDPPKVTHRFFRKFGE